MQILSALQLRRHNKLTAGAASVAFWLAVNLDAVIPTAGAFDRSFCISCREVACKKRWRFGDAATAGFVGDIACRGFKVFFTPTWNVGL